MKSLAPVLLYGAIYAYLMISALSYDHAWMHPEKFDYEAATLRGGYDFALADLRQIFNYVDFEQNQPRATRPVATLFDYVDTKLRAQLWRYLPPHPSLSLNLFLVLILSPIVLYRLLIRMEISPWLSHALVSTYLLSPTTLSYVSNLFRSAKPLMTFFFIFCLYLADKIREALLLGAGVVVLRKRVCVLAGALLLACQCDETSILIYPTLFVFYSDVVCESRWKTLFFVLPLVTLAQWCLLNPLLAQWAGYPFPNLLSYEPALRVGPLFSIEFFATLALNGKILLSETLSLFDPRSYPLWWGKVILIGPWIFLVFFCWTQFEWLKNIRVLKGSIDRWAPHRMLLYLIFLCLVHHVLLNKVLNVVWGPYWYGSFWVVFFILYIGICLSRSRLSRFSVGSLIVLLPAMALTFPYLNDAYREFHFYPYHPLKMRDVFVRRINRFELPTAKVGSRRDITIDYWNGRRKHSQLGFAIPKELLYLPVELGVQGFYPYIPNIIRNPSDWQMAPTD